MRLRDKVPWASSDTTASFLRAKQNGPQLLIVSQLLSEESDRVVVLSKESNGLSPSVHCDTARVSVQATLKNFFRASPKYWSPLISLRSRSKQPLGLCRVIQVVVRLSSGSSVPSTVVTYRGRTQFRHKRRCTVALAFPNA